MTYIEFFDEVASRNISTCLTYAPDRVIYVGADLDLMEEHKKRYERIFRDRATDMGIYVLEGLWKMSDAQLSKKLRTLWMDQSL